MKFRAYLVGLTNRIQIVGDYIPEEGDTEESIRAQFMVELEEIYGKLYKIKDIVKEDD